MSALTGTTVAIVGLALLWVGIAAAVALAAARRFGLAETVLGSARSTAALLEAAPARPLLVRSDGGIEIDKRLAREMGLTSEPATLDDLAGDGAGLAPEDLEQLGSAIKS